MSSALCPHLVQEYFERVSDIVMTYRLQILKQVEYDKVSENLVLRGAIRDEEHHRILKCNNQEGQVNQMLVVVQNRMWGLENLLAACMEEHVSPWLSQELFRAYTEHLVIPLKRQRDNPICQCVQLPSSMIYRGWVRILKSLDSLILKTGTSLGFMKQTLYPTDNMLMFLSDKLAEYTGGDSCSSLVPSQEDLVPYGFAPNASGEVQVAELEDDDINDLLSLSETLCIGYQQSSDETTKEGVDEDQEPKKDGSKVKVKRVSIQNDPKNDFASKKPPTENTPPQRKNIVKRKTTTSGTRRASPVIIRNRTSSAEHETTDSDRQEQSEENTEKLSRQRELIARLSSPKSMKASSTGSATPLRQIRRSPSVDAKPSVVVNVPKKERPKSAEFHFEKKSSTPESSSAIASKVYTESATSRKDMVASGKTKGFVRSKGNVTTSPTTPGTRRSPKTKPTAVTKPTVQVSLKKDKSLDNQATSIFVPKESKAPEEIADDPVLSKNTPLFNQEVCNDDIELAGALPDMSLMMLSNTVLADIEDKKKSLAYYQLNFDSFSDDE